MTEAEPRKTPSGVEQSAPAVETGDVPRDRVAPLACFLQFVVVVAGIVLGTILALIIGFATGWMTFSC